MQRVKPTDTERDAALERRRAANRKRMQMKRMDPRYREYERARRARNGEEARRWKMANVNGTGNTSHLQQYDERKLSAVDGRCSVCFMPMYAGFNSCCCSTKVEPVCPTVSAQSEVKTESSTIDNSAPDLPIVATVELPDLKESKPVQEEPIEKQKKLVYPLKSYEKICTFQNSAPANQNITPAVVFDIKGNTFVSNKTDICIDPGGTLCYIHDSYIYKDTVTFMGRFMITCKEEGCPAWGVLVKKILFLSMGHTHEPVECDADKIKLYSILKNSGSTAKLLYNIQVATRKSAVEGACENIILLLLKQLKDLRTAACTEELISKLQQIGYQGIPHDINYTNFMSLYETLPEISTINTESDTSTNLLTEMGISNIKTEAFERYSRINEEPLTDVEKNKLRRFIFKHLGQGDGDLEEDSSSAFGDEKDENGDVNDFESFSIKKEEDESCNKDSYLESEFSIKIKNEDNQETLYLMQITHEPDEIESDFIW